MKKYIYCIFFLLVIVKVNSQVVQQKFPSDRFKIACPCKLYENAIFLESINKQGIKYPVSAYVCAENENNFATVTIININIYDLSNEYSSDFSNNYLFEERFLIDYQNNILKNNISCSSMSFNGTKAFTYNFSQSDLPTKAMVFIKNRKAFLLQVGSRSKLDEKFSRLISSFEIFN